MEHLSGGEKVGFLKHVFNMDDASKNEMSNAIQYAFLAVLPVVAMNKALQHWIPEASDVQPTLQLILEVLFQLALLCVGFLLIHRMVVYVPTYSGDAYASFHVTNILIVFLVIVLSLPSKLGEKINILMGRLHDAWNGGDKGGSGGGNNRKPHYSSRPSLPNNINSNSNNNSNTDSTPLSSLESFGVGGGPSSPLPPSPPSLPPVDDIMAANAGMTAFGSPFG